jgi:hypothetical protein
MAKSKTPTSKRPAVRVQRLVRCAFTRMEAEHLHYLLFNNKQEGWYCGPREQYWNRHDRILNKLSVGASNDQGEAQPTRHIKRKPKPLPAHKLIGFLKDHRPLEFEREPDREF